MTPGEMNQRLIEIDDELNSLGLDDFARRLELAAEADAVRSAVRSALSDDVAAVKAEWADRAGRKGGHEVDVAALEARAKTFPFEGGVG